MNKMVIEFGDEVPKILVELYEISKETSLFGFEFIDQASPSGQLRYFLKDGIDSKIAFLSEEKELLEECPIVLMHSEGTVKSVVAKNLKDFLTSVHLGNYLTSKIAEYFNHVELVQLFGEDDVDAVEEFSDVEIKAIESELKNEFNNYSLLLDFLKEKGVETSTKVISPLVDVLNMYPNLNFDQ